LTDIEHVKFQDNIVLKDVYQNASCHYKIISWIVFKMSYSVEERLQLYECYIRNIRNSLLALREYRTLHPNNRVPTKQIFSRILRDLANGVLVNKGRNRPKNVLTEEKQLEILLYFEENNETSQRTAELDIDNVSRRSIGRALDMHGYHPYKIGLL